VAIVRQVDSGFGTDALQKPVGCLEQDTRPVAGVLLASTGAAVLEVEQNFKCLFDDRMCLGALEVSDEADATSVVLVRRIL